MSEQNGMTIEAALCLLAIEYDTKPEYVRELLDAARGTEVFGTDQKWLHHVLVKRARDAEASRQNGKKEGSGRRGRPSAVDDDTLALYATEVVFNPPKKSGKQKHMAEFAKYNALTTDQEEAIDRGLKGPDTATVAKQTSAIARGLKGRMRNATDEKTDEEIARILGEWSDKKQYE